MFDDKWIIEIKGNTTTYCHKQNPRLIFKIIEYKHTRRGKYCVFAGNQIIGYSDSDFGAVRILYNEMIEYSFFVNKWF